MALNRGGDPYGDRCIACATAAVPPPRLFCQCDNKSHAGIHVYDFAFCVGYAPARRDQRVRNPDAVMLERIKL